jgi:hypothetical protein
MTRRAPSPSRNNDPSPLGGAAWGRLERALELIAAEYALRCRLEPGCDPAEYLGRFPQYRPELPARLQPPPGPGAAGPSAAGVEGPAEPGAAGSGGSPGGAAPPGPASAAAATPELDHAPAAAAPPVAGRARL